MKIIRVDWEVEARLIPDPLGIKGLNEWHRVRTFKGEAPAQREAERRRRSEKRYEFRVRPRRVFSDER